MKVRHVSGEYSRLGFKSYEQGWEEFQGTAKDIVWLDEEPSMEIYTECLIRTMTTDGLVMLTFTPKHGWTDVVQSFLKENQVLYEEMRQKVDVGE
jgi:phage terminase large subunit-like protein